MSLLLWLLVVLATVLLSYGLNIVLAIRTATEPRPMLALGISAAPATAAQAEVHVVLTLSLRRGPKQVTVLRISLDHDLAAATGAQPPEGFVEVEASLPSFDDFEADLTPITGVEVTDQWMREEKVRQYNDYVRLIRKEGQETVSWSGRAVVCRGKPRKLRIPVRTDALAQGALTVAYHYRVGLLWGHSSASLHYRGPLGDYG